MTHRQQRDGWKSTVTVRGDGDVVCEVVPLARRSKTVELSHAREESVLPAHERCDSLLAQEARRAKMREKRRRRRRRAQAAAAAATMSDCGSGKEAAGDLDEAAASTPLGRKAPAAAPASAGSASGGGTNADATSKQQLDRTGSLRGRVHHPATPAFVFGASKADEHRAATGGERRKLFGPDGSSPSKPPARRTRREAALASDRRLTLDLAAGARRERQAAGSSKLGLGLSDAIDFEVSALEWRE